MSAPASINREEPPGFMRRRLHGQGVALRTIAEQLGVSAMTVHRIITGA